MSVTVHIECGDLDWIGTASTYKHAFRKAVREQKPERLGVLYRFRHCTDSDHPIYSTPYFYADAQRHLVPPKRRKK